MPGIRAVTVCQLVGVQGFEPWTSWSQTRRSTKLSYTPKLLHGREIKSIHRVSRKNFVRLLCPVDARDAMGAPESRSEQVSAKKDSFEKVGECLCRYTSNGTYYARVEKEGKEFRRACGHATARSPGANSPISNARSVARCLVPNGSRWRNRPTCTSAGELFSRGKSARRLRSATTTAASVGRDPWDEDTVFRI